ncbi:TIGR04222 domain-containing membrane protein [Streptomyces pactum]|uniref:TIGR04222 domain-containing membrane protein n=1 Tax=Streptomyces pactum TaxID=68249 RepID=A0ABS0NQL9_9ACTN|nr:TIGR04222 domain-containing membrane protein [Streptomyces pactum]MBH5337499.1 TIGR04222 domain-containing membrane protein [Streptomyces pactum]
MFWVLFLIVAWGAAGLSCARLCTAALAAAEDGPAPAAARGGLTLYEAAFLSGGPGRVTDLTLVSMYRQRRILLAHTGWVTVVDPEGRDDLERSVITAIGPGGQAPVPPVQDAVAGAQAVVSLADRLVATGLAVPPAARDSVASAVRQVRAAAALVVLTAVVTALMVPPASGAGTALAWYAPPLLLTGGALAVARAEAHPYTRWASPAGQRLLGGITVPGRRPRSDDGTVPRGPSGLSGPSGTPAADPDLAALAVHGTGALTDPALRAALRTGRRR